MRAEAFSIVVIAFFSAYSCSEIAAQKREGASSPRSTSGLSTSSAAGEEEQPVLTRDTLDAWLQQQMRQLAAGLRAARKGSVNPKARPSNVIGSKKAGATSSAARSIVTWK